MGTYDALRTAALALEMAHKRQMLALSILHQTLGVAGPDEIKAALMEVDTSDVDVRKAEGAFKEALDGARKHFGRPRNG